MAETWLLATRCPGYRWRDSGLGSGTELENLLGGAKRKGASGGPARPKVSIRRAGADCLVVAMKRPTTAERRGRVIRAVIDSVNRQRDEPTGDGGGRQPSMGGTSRVMGDHQARICEGLGVRFPGATRPVRPYQGSIRSRIIRSNTSVVARQKPSSPVAATTAS